ncbi:hypothetical protein K491DRAFT_482960 [Lophiostoma macrostomum CBS 122681]|uniref:Uncharacterized protein n=1 Tax=Lophiostoma macrostomum CBS 122681 TaxID=1314788 RepID=A0A6A6TP53_9PLEO|nr:hypothetical protein K491DRAFT_482960 [Lophiostoma macrostomum CBS 122681]
MLFEYGSRHGCIGWVGVIALAVFVGRGTDHHRGVSARMGEVPILPSTPMDGSKAATSGAPVNALDPSASWSSWSSRS